MRLRSKSGDPEPPICAAVCHSMPIRSGMQQGDLDVLIVLRALGEGGDVDKGSDFE